MENSLLDLIRKYDQPGPRYTSYPPAPIFSPKFGPADHRASILNSESQSSDLSLYFHIPFCDSLCYFCGCTTIITKNRAKIDDYLIYLKKEINLVAPLLRRDRRVVQMHWGGGTPTYLTPDQIRELAGLIRGSFTFDAEAEISVEVDPRELSFDHLQALRSSGFNRLSLGVQDFDPKVQQSVNRVQGESLTRQAVEWSRQLGFSSINVDLIYGLPLQTVDSFSATLDRIIDIAPNRIAVYSFAYVPWMKKHQTVLHAEDLPTAETKLALLTATIDKLAGAGYVYIGMDHFAKADDELTIARRNKTLRRNFQGYSTKAGSDLYGMGLSAISHFGTTYAQNSKTLADYTGAIGRGEFATCSGYAMTPDDEIRKYVIMKIMCDLALEFVSVERKFGIRFAEYFTRAMQKLQPMIDDGLIVPTPNGLLVTDHGRLFLRNIAMCFDAYIRDSQDSPVQKPMYSRTV